MIATLRLLLSGMVAFALLLAPLGFSGTADASDAQAHASMTQDGHAGHGNHGDAGHGLAHCGFVSCVPVFIIGPQLQISPATRSSLSLGRAPDDSLLRSFSLDCDPPVPRGGFSKA